MSSEVKTKVIVTKYALTEGPFKVIAEISHGGSMASYRIGNSYLQSAHGKDFWLTEEEAIADCERRRVAKIKSIEKQKKKLENMTFTIVEASA
ncbi:hypothetical protein M8320_09120 [Leclercia sp. H6W5]|uniref:hypothetical protein n=1 Tax=Leclercia tamurae TaxID=2926467 RepID=UPI0021CE736D|nr:hypothetical protein [Leclercia tamurae]MCU6682162.1 hypothetical protein [Leclercia tamurae]